MTKPYDEVTEIEELRVRVERLERLMIVLRASLNGRGP